MLYYLRQRAKKGLMSTLSIQGSSGTDVVLLKTKSKERAYIIISSLWSGLSTLSIQGSSGTDVVLLKTKSKERAYIIIFSLWSRLLTLSKQGSSSTDVVLLRTKSKERAYVDTVDTRLIRYWCCTIEDKEQRKGLCRHCRYKAHPVLMLYYWVQRAKKGLMLTLSIQGSSGTDVLLKTKSKERAYVNTVDTRLIRYWCCTIEDKEQRKGLCRHCRYKAHPALMLYYWRQRGNKKLIHACNEIRSHTNSFHCICRHCRYKQDTLLNTQ